MKKELKISKKRTYSEGLRVECEKSEKRKELFRNNKGRLRKKPLFLLCVLLFSFFVFYIKNSEEKVYAYRSNLRHFSSSDLPSGFPAKRGVCYCSLEPLKGRKLPAVTMDSKYIYGTD